MENPKNMKQVNFEIEKVYAGWFDISFKYDDKSVGISASDAWGNDAPRELLKILEACCKKEECNKYVIFDEEPGSYVICIEKAESVIMTVFATDIDSDEWKGLDLHGDLSYEEISDYAIHRDEPEILLREEIDFKYFIQTVIRAFEEYAEEKKKKAYEGNWMEFPEMELKNLTALLV